MFPDGSRDVTNQFTMIDDRQQVHNSKSSPIVNGLSAPRSASHCPANRTSTNARGGRRILPKNLP